GAFLACLFFVSHASAADWKQQERQCMSTCPELPRYGGIESEAAYAERMKKQAAYDQCFMKCARLSSQIQPRSFVPIGTPEYRYFKRNGQKAN
ncbi:MAG: hypothetical protein KKC99_07000, partial [Proteobacteria bacterium]|nr:hypothetical protein [Pseudomonadota bacterium]